MVLPEHATKLATSSLVPRVRPRLTSRLPVKIAFVLLLHHVALRLLPKCYHIHIAVSLDATGLGRLW